MLQVMEIIGRILGHELHVVIEAGMTDRLDHRGPGGMDVGGDRGTSAGEQCPQLVGSHPFSSSRRLASAGMFITAITLVGCEAREIVR